MNRTDRYSGILDPATLENAEVAVIGVGAIGRQIAIQLASMGVGNIQLVDFDIVNTDNLGSQGWTYSDIGLHKVDALATTLQAINPLCKVTISNRRFHRSDDARHPVIFACVDSMKIRKMMFESAVLKGHCQCFIDGRMGAESFRAFMVTNDSAKKEYYQSTLYSDHEAFTGSCTARTTIYCSNIVAGHMTALYSQFLRNIPAPKEIEGNVLANGTDAIY